MTDPTQAQQDLATKVIAVCEKDWDADKSDCSGFVKAVAADLGIHLTGLANDIVKYARANWQAAKDGVDAAGQAAQGNLVIGGLEDNPNGHVVVVVRGGLNREKYPTAYWGQLGGVGKKDTTINWAWPLADRDLVEYYFCSLNNTVTAIGPPVRVIT
jgi:hypothetical protein